MDRRKGRPRLYPSVRARVTFALLAVSLATQPPWAPAHAASTSIPPVTQPIVGPEAALERYARAFRERSPDGVGAVLTADYRFHQLNEGLEDYVTGFDRAVEMNSTRGMLVGVKRDGVVVMPPPDSVTMNVDGIQQNFDPEHPDSTEHYRVLTVRKIEIRLARSDGWKMYTPPSLNVLHLVRGDAAVLAEGQSPDRETWYIRRWLNDVNGVQTVLREREGGCGEDDPPPGSPGDATAASLADRPSVLAIRPLMNPACAKLELKCDLPGSEPARIEVYDVSGRRIHQRQVPATDGVVTVEAGRGAKILPGVYWVRLSQASRRPSTRMVVVAR